MVVPMLLSGHTSSLNKEQSGSMVNSWCLQFLDLTMLLQLVLAGTIDEMARIEVFFNPITFLAPIRFRRGTYVVTRGLWESSAQGIIIIKVLAITVIVLTSPLS